MELVLAYGAGLLTLVNPCVLPVLPIALAGALEASRWGPAALAAGMGLSFVALGLFVTAAGRSLGLTEETVAQAGAALMVGFGLVLLVPAAGRGFALATAGDRDPRPPGSGGRVRRRRPRHRLPASPCRRCLGDRGASRLADRPFRFPLTGAFPCCAAISLP